MDDPAFGRVPRAAARSPTRKRVPGRTYGTSRKATQTPT